LSVAFFPYYILYLCSEPTNNLDVETIDALVEAMNAFNGGIVVVTHDQRLIEECNCELWVVEKQGVTKWEAGFDDYKEDILRQLEEEAARESAIRHTKIVAAAAAKAEKIARLAGKVKKSKK
jgi:ABC-type multidrug transport system ATPase subunit